MVTLAATEVAGSAPQRGIARSIVAMAMRAPSLHNTQPWRWRNNCVTNTCNIHFRIKAGLHQSKY